MKKRNQLKSLKIPIDHVWEACLIKMTWEKVSKESARRNTTYSWIVRFCVFRFVNQLKTLDEEKYTTALQECKSQLKENITGLHRLQLCLYGDDIFLIRSVAMRLGISVAMLIRVALDFYLDKLIKNQVSRVVFYWHGIKLITKAIEDIEVKQALTKSWHWRFLPFLEGDYWKMPKPPTKLMFSG